jgi:hypothetical protein
LRILSTTQFYDELLQSTISQQPTGKRASGPVEASRPLRRFWASYQ